MPPLDQYILPSITRAVIKELCEENGIPTKERIVTVDEVFELAKMNMFGAILGKAIYNGNIDLAEAVKAEKI